MVHGVCGVYKILNQSTLVQEYVKYNVNLPCGINISYRSVATNKKGHYLFMDLTVIVKSKDWPSGDRSDRSSRLIINDHLLILVYC